MPPEDLAPLLMSLRVATLATLVIALVGLPTALLLARGRFLGRELIGGLLTLPMVLPPTVLGFVLLQILGPRGPVGSLIDRAWGGAIVFHWTGAVIAAAIAAFPLFLLPARSAIEGVDPSLEDAARLLGRDELGVFLAVTLPLAWRGLAAGLLLAFTRALGDFGTTLMVAGNIPGRTQTAPLALFDAVNGDDPGRAWRLAAWVAGMAILMVWLARRGLVGHRVP